MTVARGALIGAVGGAALAASFAAGATVKHAQPAPGVTVTARATPSSASTTASPDTGWSALAAGGCLRDFDSAWQQAYRVVACSERHAARVAALVPIDDARRPEDADLVGRLSLACSDAAADGPVTSTWPSAAEWDAGTRVGICFAVAEAA